MKNPNELETIVRYSRMRKACPPALVVQEYKALRRLSRTLTTIDTNYCNGTQPYNTSETALESAHRSVYARLNKILKPYGLHYYHQSDPRGAALYVSTSPVDHQNYTSALCIY